MVSQIQWTYDLREDTVCDSPLLSKSEYDFGVGAPGALLRKTVYEWLQLDTPSYEPPLCSGSVSSGGENILDRKTSETVYDGSGNLMAQTKYEYDNYTAGIATSGATTNYASAVGNPGNLTAVSRWNSTTSAWLVTRYQYDNVGNVVSKTDPNGNVTKYSYADNYVSGPSGTTAAFLTKTTYPAANSVAHVAQSQYYWGSGLVAASCGENFSGTCAAGATTGADYATYTYDLMGRKISTVTGDGGKSTTCYSEVSGGSCYSDAYPLQVTSSETIASGVTKTSTATLDGIARTVKSQLTSDSQGTVTVDTTYDADGHQLTVSNPYRSTSDSTYGLTSYAYDGLGRVTQVTHPDKSYATNTYTGRAVLSAD
jgi:YD repeat-containing protein